MKIGRLRLKQIISSYGNFESRIAEYIYSELSIDNKNMNHLIELFSN
jgi:hypothetical protein